MFTARGISICLKVDNAFKVTDNLLLNGQVTLLYVSDRSFRSTSLCHILSRSQRQIHIDTALLRNATEIGLSVNPRTQRTRQDPPWLNPELNKGQTHRLLFHISKWPPQTSYRIISLQLLSNFFGRT